MDCKDEGYCIFLSAVGPAEGDADAEHLSSPYHELRVFLALHHVELLCVVLGSILGHQQVHRLHVYDSVRPLRRCNTQHNT